MDGFTLAMEGGRSGLGESTGNALFYCEQSRLGSSDRLAAFLRNNLR